MMATMIATTMATMIATTNRHLRSVCDACKGRAAVASWCGEMPIRVAGDEIQICCDVDRYAAT